MGNDEGKQGKQGRVEGREEGKREGRGEKRMELMDMETLEVSRALNGGMEGKGVKREAKKKEINGPGF